MTEKIKSAVYNKKKRRLIIIYQDNTSQFFINVDNDYCACISIDKKLYNLRLIDKEKEQPTLFLYEVYWNDGILDCDTEHGIQINSLEIII